MIHCPKCDAMFEARDGALAETACPHCGRIVAAAPLTSSDSKTPTSDLFAANHGGADFWFAEDAKKRSGFSLLGHPGLLHWTKNVAVRLSSSVCRGCGQKIPRGISACPHCGRAPKKSSVPKSTGFGAVLRKMVLAATVFIGLPAAVIVFVLVVCAPEGGDANAPQPARAGIAQRSGAPSGEPDESDAGVPRRGPLAGLRSIRAWLRGAEHRSSGVPAKTPLEKAGEGPSQPHVPPMGTRDREQIKPDPVR
jgi:hypothetical protein